MISETCTKIRNLYNCDCPLQSKANLNIWIEVNMYEHVHETKFGTRTCYSACCTVTCAGKKLESSYHTLKECKGDIDLLNYTCLLAWCLENGHLLKGKAGEEVYQKVWESAEEELQLYNEYADEE